MKYSVVTTVYNDENEIVKFLDCLLSQTYLPNEIIIADGGSNDNTKLLIQQYSSNSQIPIKLIFGKRLNIAQGFNEAIKSASNAFVAITAVGNWYPPDFFSVLCNEIEKDNTLDAVYSLIKGTDITPFAKIYTAAFIGNGMCLKYPSNHGVLIKKSVIEDLGYFYEKFEYAGEDFEFFLHFLEKGKRCRCIKTVYLIWDVPKSYKEYCKQIKVYTIGKMQVYDNVLFLLKNRNVILYSFLWLLLGSSFRRYLVLVLAIININWITKCGVKGSILRNCDSFLTVFYLIKEYKYFFDNNKIDAERRIKKI